MKRRDLLKGLAALPLVGALPAAAKQAAGLTFRGHPITTVPTLGGQQLFIADHASNLPPIPYNIYVEQKTYDRLVALLGAPKESA
jgi:hypothetical protein